MLLPSWYSGELSIKFHHVISVDSAADADVQTTVCTRWNKFRQLAPLPTARMIPFLSQGSKGNVIQKLCVCGSNTWPGYEMGWFGAVSVIQGKTLVSMVGLEEGKGYFAECEL